MAKASERNWDRVGVNKDNVALQQRNQPGRETGAHRTSGSVVDATPWRTRAPVVGVRKAGQTEEPVEEGSGAITPIETRLPGGFRTAEEYDRAVADIGRALEDLDRGTTARTYEEQPVPDIERGNVGTAEEVAGGTENASTAYLRSQAEARPDDVRYDEDGEMMPSYLWSAAKGGRTRRSVRADDGGGTVNDVVDEELERKKRLEDAEVGVKEAEAQLKETEAETLGRAPYLALNTAFSGLMQKLENSHGRVQMSHVGGPMPAQAGKRYAFLAAQNAGRFTLGDAKMLAGIADAVGKSDEVEGLLNQFGIRTRSQKERSLEFAKASNQHTEAVDAAIRRKEQEDARLQNLYAAWGGKDRYDSAMELKKFYDSNKERWGDVLERMTGGSMALADFNGLSREKKLALIQQAASAQRLYYDDDTYQSTSKEVAPTLFYDRETKEITPVGARGDREVSLGEFDDSMERRLAEATATWKSSWDKWGKYTPPPRVDVDWYKKKHPNG